MAKNCSLFQQLLTRKTSVLLAFGLVAIVHASSPNSALPLRLPDGKWNCSVPYWADFQQHFLCNLNQECVGMEDEADCPYTTDICGLGRIAVGKGCYIFMRLEEFITWEEASRQCLVHGGVLASLNTPEEWRNVIELLEKQKLDVFLDRLENVYADNYKLCCPATLPAGFNLPQCRAPTDEISSCDALLRSDVYRVLLAVFAALAVIGNLSSFVYRTFLNKTKSALGFGVFVTHLKTFPGQSYSFGIMIVLNFVVFLLIATGQAFIYWSIRSNSMSTSDSTKKSKDLTIARRLFTVVLSDFLCWFPIGLLGLLAANDVAIPGEVSVAMAIIVLPLNSALNPFLYTVNVILERRRQATERRIERVVMSKIKAQSSVMTAVRS
nr:hypothetical protein BaRGS_026862 [Batillaria attramentaria]